MTPQRESKPEMELELPRLVGHSKVEEASQRLATRFELARQVIRARAMKNWTQAELAKAAGTKQSRVSEMESAKGNPTLDTIERILLALELKVSFGPSNFRAFFCGPAPYADAAAPTRQVGRVYQRGVARKAGRLVQSPVSYERTGHFSNDKRRGSSVAPLAMTGPA